MARKSTRRDFLWGKAAADVAADLAQRALAEATAGSGGNVPISQQSNGEETYLLHIARDAMACQFQVFLNAGQYDQDTEASLAALDVVERLEDELSYFRPTSQVSQLNALAAQRPAPVEPPLFALLELAQQIHAQTDGAMDITATPLWEVWGFSRREGKLPSEEELAQAIESVGCHLMELDPERRTVFFKRAGVRLNLGCIGKGYALDRAAEVLLAAGVGDFLFHGGQSSVLARGSHRGLAGPGDGPAGWCVGIRHPLRPEGRLAEIRLVDRAMGTSGSQMQFFWHQGKRYSHLLDPRTGRPAEGVFLATVLAPTAALADGLSTALFVMGKDRAMEFCRSRPELAAVLVCPTERGTGCEIHSTGFRPWELCILDSSLPHTAHS